MHGTLAMARRKRVDRAPGPTPERMAKAGEAFDVGHHGIITFRDSPVEWARRREILSEGQYAAATKLRHHWYHAGLSDRIGSLDLNRVFSSDHGNPGMAVSEQQAHHRQQYRAAQQAMGQRIGSLVDNIVCREMQFVDAGQKMGWRDYKQARAVAQEFLREGLDVLRRLWGI